MGRLALVPVEELPFGARTLRFRCKGRDVEELQRILVNLGLLYTKHYGVYDYLTEEAVKAFQRSFQLRADGITGPLTLKMLREPGIWDKLLLRARKEESLNEIAARYGVMVRAVKNPENRRPVIREEVGGKIPAGEGCLLLIEEREIWMEAESHPAAEKVEPYVSAETLAAPKEADPKGRIRVYPVIFPPAEPGIARGEQGNGSDFLAGIVCDLRPVRTLSADLRRRIKKMKERTGREFFWWLDFSVAGYGFSLPAESEADGVILSPAVRIDPTYSQRDWRREVKRVLANYPCTRMIIHFDLQGLERTASGEIRALSPREGRVIQLSQRTRSRRADENGWKYYRYQHKEEEREALIPDAGTVRGILAAMDELNLRGVFFTGARHLAEKINKEFNRFFIPSPRLIVIKE